MTKTFDPLILLINQLLAEVNSGIDPISKKKWNEMPLFIHNAKLFCLLLIHEFGGQTVVAVEEKKVFKMVWRKPFIDLLNQMCMDDDYILQKFALPIQVEYIGISKVQPSKLVFSL